MKRVWIGGVAVVLAGISITRGEARELEDILSEKGVITGEEAAESKSARAPKGTALNLHWDKGIRASSADGNFKLKIGGRIMNDWAYMSGDDDLETFFGEEDDEGNIEPEEFGSGTEFRRARLYVEGDVYERFTFKAQYDFAGGDADFKDVYLGIKGVGPLGKVLVGHFKEPFSLEELTSSKYITFMERSLPNLFAPGRNSGFGFFHAVANERITYAAGVFREVDDFGFGFGGDDDYNLTGRLTGLPIFARDGRMLAHLGVAYSYQNRESDVRFRERPEVHLSPVRFVDTGNFAADGINLLGLEAAGVFGPVSVQGEYIGNYVDSGEAGDPDLDGFYVYASVFLTGENRAYKPGSGAFDRVKPKGSFLDGKGGMGAWEAAVRYSNVDLSDGGVGGGELDDITAGVNWYMNPNVRVMANYVFADLDSVGEANTIQARFQIDF